VLRPFLGALVWAVMIVVPTWPFMIGLQRRLGGRRWAAVTAMTVLLIATFAGGVANLVAIVGFMVTATSGLPDTEQGLATGLATMSQQIGITMGIPVMSAIASARIHALGGPRPSTVLSGVSTALTVNAAMCVAAALLITVFLPGPATAEETS